MNDENEESIKSLLKSINVLVEAISEIVAEVEKLTEINKALIQIVTSAYYEDERLL